MGEEMSTLLFSSPFLVCGIEKKLLLMVRKKKPGGIIWSSNCLVNNRAIKLIGLWKQVKGFHVITGWVEKYFCLLIGW